MWIAVGVGYAWSVWKLDRLWRHAPREDSARGEPKVVLSRRLRVTAGHPVTGLRDGRTSTSAAPKLRLSVGR